MRSLNLRRASYVRIGGRLAVAATLLALCLPQSYSAQVNRTAPTPESCRNLPVSSAQLQPSSCAAIATTGVVATGTVPNSTDGLAAVLTDSTRSFARFTGTGPLSIQYLTDSEACIRDQAGASTGVSLADGSVTAATVAACGANGEISPATTKSSSALSAQLTSAHTALKTAAAPQGPAANYSYYVASTFVSKCAGNATTTCPLWQMGNETSVPIGGALNIIDFGAACEHAGVPGVQTFFVQTCYPESTIAALLQRWIAGYEAGHGGDTPPSIIAAGVSNSVNGISGDPQTTPEMGTIGDAFGSQVVKATEATVGNLAAPLTVWGALDAEQANGGDWLGPAPTRAFVDSFGAATGHTPSTTNNCVGAVSPGMLADFGDAVYMEPGFDPKYPGGWGSNGGWTVGDIYHVAYGAPSACSVPEVYFDINAAEWASLSDWATKQGLAAIKFTAAMSENGNGSGCASGNGDTCTSQESWASLNQWTGQNVPYLTNIAWSIVVNSATLNALPSSENTAAFPVTWQTANGIANATYRLFSQDTTTGAGWAIWADNVTTSSSTFFGVPGHSYGFFIQTYGGGYNNGGPGSAQTSTTISASATATLPYPLYAVDGYGYVRPASSPPQVVSASWQGWNIARGIAMLPNGSGGYVLDGWGQVHPFGSAPALPISQYWQGWDIARSIVLTPSGQGGYVLDGWGGVHPFGNAPALTTTARWDGWDIARGIVLTPSGNGGYVLDGWGGMHPIGNAPQLATPSRWPGWDIARSVVLTPSGLGGYVLDGWGGVHTIGDATAVASPAYWQGWDIARSVVLVPNSTQSGWVVDGYGGFHPFGTAPQPTDDFYAPRDLVRSAAS